MSRRAAAARSLCLAASAIVVSALAGSCADPVHDQLVASLPAEDPAIPQGEFHRAGQPCLACHGSEGPAKTEFAIAGTIFWHQSKDTVGVDQAAVSIIDSLGANPVLQTNCVGNFFVRPGDWPGGSGPAFPLRVAVFKGDIKKSMSSLINRAGSCAECHFDPPNYNLVGHVWMSVDTAAPEAASDCPVSPQVDLNYGTL
jgi:hypothetical protein